MNKLTDKVRHSAIGNGHIGDGEKFCNYASSGIDKIGPESDNEGPGRQIAGLVIDIL